MTDQEERIPRDFSARDPDEQAAFLENTWCNHCQEIDLGMTNPQEYEISGRIFVEGQCVKCGQPTITEIADDEEVE